MEVCESCLAIDTSYIGLHGPDFDQPRGSKQKRQFKEVAEAAKSCAFCEDLIAAFGGRVLPAFGQHRNLIDFSNIDVLIDIYRLPSLGINNDGKPQGHLVRLSIEFWMRHPDMAIRGQIAPSIYYQKTQPQPPSVKNMLDENSLLQWPVQEPYTARLVSLDADLRLFRKWLSTCSQWHEHRCEHTYNGTRLPRIRLIDVSQRCLVWCTGDVNWVALSYIWGERKFLRLSSDTEAWLETPGSITADNVPATITDAMTVTAEIGEKYLWVDCLCIKQDDQAELSELIPRMDSIYGHSTVTLIEATGKDAYNGLTGVRKASRSVQPKPLCLNGVWLLETLDNPVTLDTVGV